MYSAEMQQFLSKAILGGGAKSGETPPWEILANLLKAILEQEKLTTKNMLDAANAFRECVSIVKIVEERQKALAEAVEELLQR